MASTSPVLLIVMGVSGCGKTTVGRALAERCGLPFLDADDFHPPHNIEMMRKGRPLMDSDRSDWVIAIRDGVSRQSSHAVVLACSCLTPFVQDGLAVLPHRLIYIHLDTTRVDMAKRFAGRDHFMPVELLQSQYDALSVPDAAFCFDASRTVPDLVEAIVTSLPSFISERCDALPTDRTRP